MKQMYRILEKDKDVLQEGDFVIKDNGYREYAPKKSIGENVCFDDKFFRPLFKKSNIENMSEILETLDEVLEAYPDSNYFNEINFTLQNRTAKGGTYSTISKIIRKPKEPKLISLEKIVAIKHVGTMRYVYTEGKWREMEILGFSSRLKMFIIELEGDLRKASKCTLDDMEGK